MNCRVLLLAIVGQLLCACGGNDHGESQTFTVTLEAVEVSKYPGTDTVPVDGLPARGATLVVSPND